MPYVDPRWTYYRSFGDDAEGIPEMLFRRQGGTTQRWDNGLWRDVPGASLDSHIGTGDLGYEKVSFEEAHAFLNPAGPG